jgi:L-methionine (R)-S-oxide reductase
MDKETLFQRLLSEVKSIIDGPLRQDEKLLAISRLLQEKVDYYHWVGFYIADEKRRELRLGPFTGASTEHTRIPFGNGICGLAAERKAIYVSQDVYKETNYLPCSDQVRSEIVVPIFGNGDIIGELDIDSHIVAPFTKEDEDFLSGIAKAVAGLF